MKKIVKIIIITTVSLLVVLVATVSIMLWFVFTPEKLTPMVQKQANKYLTCKSEIGSVELTFFSTYPNFGLKINQFILINPVNGAPNDTLVGLNNLVGVVDFAAWWKRNEIKIKEVVLEKGTINIFYDSLGHSNYEITPPDTSATTTTQSGPFSVDLGNIRFVDIDLAYVDKTMPMTATVQHFTGDMEGDIKSDILHSKLKVDKSAVSLAYDGEPYLLNTSVQVDMDFDFWLSYLKMTIGKASGTLNGLPVQASGSFVEDTTNQDLIFDLAFSIDPSPIEKIIPMVPPSYQSYFEGITATGLLSANGSMKGIMNATAMPLFDIHLKMNDGKLKYEGVPLTFHDVNGDVSIVTDAMTDSLTYMKIYHLEAKTDRSSFELKGLMNQLFTDVYCDLTANADLTLDEFKPMLPADLKINVNGKVSGEVKSTFTLPQLEKMETGKIKLSGALTLTNFDATYDTLWVKTPKSKIEFTLPNTKNKSGKTSFVWANIASESLQAGANTNYKAFLGKTTLALETSNVMDTTRIPDLICSFALDSLAGNMDTISLSITMPQGKMVLAPRAGYPLQPQIQLTCTTGSMEVNIGKGQASMKQLSLDANVVNDNTQKDIFQQWQATGTFGMDKGHIALTNFPYPIEVPSVKMDFDPENFNIKESKLNINKSDFQLTGSLKNILSYFRKDSILRGDFNFASDNTDVLELMALTSGLGTEDTTATADTTYSGPYMVPKGIDFNLSTNIKQASFGTDTASNINGDVRVKDGILLLDGLRLTTPATRIQLTAMYRTPRKNHLYLGIDYHMLDVEIESLLQMIPDIDSLMPMLRSFRGKGEFHLAAETYLDSLYNPKKSTIRGAASITGQNLVLMDGETFSEIAKTLKFNKKTENKVDSISAEFTVFKNEIDVYPFLIVMDKYKAVVAGRHNFDMSFDYHISVVDCPLPVKLGLDVKGTLDHMTYKLTKCQYGEYYRPMSRHIVDNKQLELRKMIRESLVEKVKEQ